MLRNVFETCWPTTTGPNVTVFSRFQDRWSTMDKARYDTGLDDETVLEMVEDKKDGILEFIGEQFQVEKSLFYL